MTAVSADLAQVRGLVKERNALMEILAQIVREADESARERGVAVIHAETLERARLVLVAGGGE
ncbi:MAG: hypothetical protein HRF47_13755 [Chloroflexota bacterium]|jgi:DNA transposition AAA+ family ATPase